MTAMRELGTISAEKVVGMEGSTARISTFITMDVMMGTLTMEMAARSTAGLKTPTLLLFQLTSMALQSLGPLTASTLEFVETLPETLSAPVETGFLGSRTEGLRPVMTEITLTETGATKLARSSQ